MENEVEQESGNLWYVRRAGKVKGPYAAGVITRYILLGRIRSDDLLSQDQEDWQAVIEHTELFPETMLADLNDAMARQRLLAARRWEDERTRVDRRENQQSVGNEQRQVGRRIEEPDEEIQHRRIRAQVREEKIQKSFTSFLSGFIAFSILAGLTAIFIFNKPETVEVAKPNCDAPPTAGVNWRGCKKRNADLVNANLIGAVLKNVSFSQADLSGSQLINADLSYADLSLSNLYGVDLRQSKLIGANLVGSNLGDANLSGADLSFADLSNAILENANLTDANLSNAQWPDGRKCAPGSVGNCF
ncbi:MAG: pentapeptide repeat-containing protein [Gammaproteobacteria bacterium]